MSRNIKHVGQIVNTQKRCVVVFRELPDDPTQCLVVDTDALPDWMHDDVINASESPGAQASANFYEYAERTVMADGTNMLQALHKTGRLLKTPTDNVKMTPNNAVSIGLTELNNIIREQSGGAPVVKPDDSQSNMVGKDVADTTTETINETTIVEDVVPQSQDAMDPQDLAKNLLAQAKTFEQEAKSLKKQAYDLAPNLKPGPKKATAKVE
tara:strand:- start:3400 stop:4032 length:633 start_codon:yes stop_codon:yes gene_type:complete